MDSMVYAAVDTMVLWCSGFMVLWFYGFDEMVLMKWFWRNSFDGMVLKQWFCDVHRLKKSITSILLVDKEKASKGCGCPQKWDASLQMKFTFGLLNPSNLNVITHCCKWDLLIKISVSLSPARPLTSNKKTSHSPAAPLRSSTNANGIGFTTTLPNQRINHMQHSVDCSCSKTIVRAFSGIV